MNPKSRYPAGFHRWIATEAGKKVWADFQNKALVMARVRKYYSATAIAQVIRWETALRGGDDFKLNNNWIPGLARHWLSIHGREHPAFFQLRDPMGWNE